MGVVSAFGAPRGGAEASKAKKDNTQTQNKLKGRQHTKVTMCVRKIMQNGEARTTRKVQENNAISLNNRSSQKE